MKSYPGSIVVTNEEEARKAVTEAKEQGADFIKVYSFLTIQAYAAIANEAKKREFHLPGTHRG